MMLAPFNYLVSWLSLSQSLLNDQLNLHTPVPSAEHSLVPTIRLDTAQVTGTYHTQTKTNQYLGIPFAQPPYVILSLNFHLFNLSSVRRLGPLRTSPPVPLPPYTGTIDASYFGPSCLQAPQSIPEEIPAEIRFLIELAFGSSDHPTSEDCTFIVLQNSSLPHDHRKVCLSMSSHPKSFPRISNYRSSL